MQATDRRIDFRNPLRIMDRLTAEWKKECMAGLAPRWRSPQGLACLAPASMTRNAAGFGFSSRSYNSGWFVRPRIGKPLSQLWPSSSPQRVTRPMTAR